MSTIVEYRDDIIPTVAWPYKIVSPTRSSTCCVIGMRKVGLIINEERKCGERGDRVNATTYYYSVCGNCGFAVKRIVRDVPTEQEYAKVRMEFYSNHLTRGWEW